MGKALAERTNEQTNRRGGEAAGREKEKESTAVRFELTRVTPIDFESIALTARPSCHDKPHTNTHKNTNTNTQTPNTHNTQLTHTRKHDRPHTKNTNNTHTHTHTNPTDLSEGPTGTATATGTGTDGQRHRGWGTIHNTSSTTTTN